MSFINQKELEELYKFRQELHKYPELSGYEKHTAKRLENFISRYNPDKIIRNIAGHGIAFVFGDKKASQTIMFRADMDALPIEESNIFSYKSVNKGVGHKCGHDGHMAILCGVANYLHKNPPKKFRVILLFQPEEETGQGAAKVINDKKFSGLEPDYVYALHNLPGFEKNSIVLSNNNFASASTGIKINLKGESSHAAHPEQGNSPAKLTAELIMDLEGLPAQSDLFNDFTLVTIIHAKIGEIAFGTNPGKAVLMATFRSYRNDDMNKLKEKAEKIVKDKAEKYKIAYSIDYTEAFPATVNNDDAMHVLSEAAAKATKSITWIDKPFRWSEDFGNFTIKYKGALWGLGVGINHPSLHNYDYDFTDEVIEPGIRIFTGIIDNFEL